MPKGVYERTKPAWNKGLTKADPRVAKHVHPEIPPLIRFFNKVEIADTCWDWQAYLDDEGYGHFWFDHTMKLAHVFLYELLEGPIPEGMELDHLCRNRACVNPSHVQPVIHLENIRRGDSGKPQSSRTHCPAGHPYDEVNTYISPTGHRNCRICRSRRANEYHKRIRREHASQG